MQRERKVDRVTSWFTFANMVKSLTFVVMMKTVYNIVIARINCEDRNAEADKWRIPC